MLVKGINNISGVTAVIVLVLVAYSVGMMSPEAQNPREADQTQAVGINWNSVADFILNMAKKGAVRSWSNHVVLPHITQELLKNMISNNITFRAEKGWFKDVATLQRVGNVQVFRGQNNRVIISFSVSLSQLELGYDQCTVNNNDLGWFFTLIGLRTVRGRIKGAVGTNVIKVTATIDVKDGKCTDIVVNVKVVELEGIKIEVSCSFVHFYLSSALTNACNVAAQEYKSDIVKLIEEVLSDKIAKYIKKTDYQRYVNLLTL